MPPPLCPCPQSLTIVALASLELGMKTKLVSESESHLFLAIRQPVKEEKADVDIGVVVRIWAWNPSYFRR